MEHIPVCSICFYFCFQVSSSLVLCAFCEKIVRLRPKLAPPVPLIRKRSKSVQFCLFFFFIDIELSLNSFSGCLVSLESNSNPSD